VILLAWYIREGGRSGEEEREAAASGRRPCERRLGGEISVCFCGLGFTHTEGFYSQPHNLSIDSKAPTSHELSTASQLVGRPLQLVESLQVVDSEVATGRQVAWQVATC
jgi:hypothetical protein